MEGEELSSGIAFVIFTQALGPTITLSLFNVLFLTSLRTQIIQHAPHASAAAIIGLGATGFRSIVSPEDLPGVLIAYATSINRVFYLAAGLAAACGVSLWGMGWHDIRKKEDEIEKAEVKDADAAQVGKEDKSST